MTKSALQQICISMCLCCLLFMVPQSLTPMPHTRTHLRICILPCTTHTSRTTYMAHAIVPYLSLLLFSMHSSLFKTSWSTKIFPPWFLVLFIIEFPCTQILRIRIDSGLPQLSVCLCMCGNGFVCSGFFGGGCTGGFALLSCSPHPSPHFLVSNWLAIRHTYQQKKAICFS